MALSYRNEASMKEIAEVTGRLEREAEAIVRKRYLAGDAAVTKPERQKTLRHQFS